MHEHAEKLPLTSSFISEFDPRFKILGTVYFIFMVIATKTSSYSAFYFYAAVLFMLVLSAKISFSVFLKRYLIILPFLLFIIALLPFSKRGNAIFILPLKLITLRISDAGLANFTQVFIKSFFSLCSLIILSTTTSFADIIKAFKDLKVPLIIVIMLSFMYRYLYLMINELKKMKMAVDARNFGKNKIGALKALACCVGVFFLRSYERSENVYRAMLSRNFQEKYYFSSDFKFKPKDAVFFAVFMAVVTAIYLAGVVFNA